MAGKADRFASTSLAWFISRQAEEKRDREGDAEQEQDKFEDAAGLRILHRNRQVDDESHDNGGADDGRALLEDQPSRPRRPMLALRASLFFFGRDFHGRACGMNLLLGRRANRLRPAAASLGPRRVRAYLSHTSMTGTPVPAKSAMFLVTTV